MNNKIRTFIFELAVVNSLLRILSDKQYILLHYFVINNKLPDLKHPRSFSEKIQWIKIFGGLEKYAKYVDKFTVRNHIKKIIGGKYLVPLIGVWDTFEAIPFERLPNKFVLKATHGSGYNFICKDKSTLDKSSLKKIVNRWMQENFYLKTREMQYKDCRPRILCEAYLDEGPRGLTDYKFFCRNGNPILFEIIANRFTQPTLDLFDLDGNRLPIFLDFPHAKKEIKRPKKFQEMITLSKRLSKKFPFVRVDLYSVKNKIYFGELTFTPGNGLDIMKPSHADYQLGKLIDLSAFNNN
ncbi:MAG TPA: ATP-grasp fold amidoligase family protein [Patescibacteria group bacterium]|nr:ATP-grasp fold amidoligase family protein [Patescibacteria group bacterium]